MEDYVILDEDMGYVADADNEDTAVATAIEYSHEDKQRYAVYKRIGITKEEHNAVELV